MLRLSMKSFLACGLLVVICAYPLRSAQSQDFNKLAPVPVAAVTVQDRFWSPKRTVWQETTIPDCFTKFEKDRGGALNNFDRVRDGKRDGHAGPPWYDGLVYEMIRGAADFLAGNPDPALERRLDAYIERIAAAQDKDPDGYLNTWTQLEHPEQRWGLNGGNDGYQHEMYNVGALCEAAEHFFRATGKTSLLNVAVKLANYTCSQVGAAPKYELIPNHAIVEEAFANLYLLFREHPELKRQMAVPVQEERYLELAQYWIEARGHPRKDQPSYGAYDQDHQPVFEQAALEGHAVRAALMCAGLTTLAGINGRADYSDAAIRLFDNMTEKKMYVTGGIGATAAGEAFGNDYFLPNDGYLETCGAVGAAFFARNLNLLTGEAKYADVLERELYNGALAGVSAAGNCYTYVNPLDAPNGNSRWSWNGCPCCPPMFLKLMGAMPSYIYAQDRQGIYINLFVGSKARIQLFGKPIVLDQSTDYPWNGEVTITVHPKKDAEFDLNIRVPGWCQNELGALYAPVSGPGAGGPRLRVNGKELTGLRNAQGYARVHRLWKSGDVVKVSFDMRAERLKARSEVAADKGRVALMRGPLVYCFEGTDNGAAVQNLVLSPQTQFTAKHRPDLLGGITVLEAKAMAVFRTSEDKLVPMEFPVTAVPYYANANRGACQMQVWMPETETGAKPQRQE